VQKSQRIGKRFYVNSGSEPLFITLSPKGRSRNAIAFRSLFFVFVRIAESIVSMASDKGFIAFYFFAVI
jgi:hypothetical protein